MKLRQLAMAALAVVLAPLVRRLRRRPIILVGGHEGELFADNGRAMYHYLSREQPAYDVYWVMNSGSPHWTQVERPVRRGSLRAYLYFLLAEGGFYSHTASDIAPVLHRLVRPRMVRVHLEHGVVGLKAIKLRGAHHTGHLGPDADLWASLSEFERGVKVDEWKLPEDRVKVTGHPRYDEFPRSSETRPEVVFIPTWREWLHEVSDEEFMASEFFRDLDELTSSPELRALLEERDVDLVVHLHFYFHRYAHCFKATGGRVRYAPVESAIQDALLHGRVLVTDYSSVAFDFCFHLGKPVLFHQPDLATYLTERGSYLDMPDDLFGPQSMTPPRLVAHLERALDSPQEVVTEYAPLRPTYFPFDDTANCERVFGEFLRALDQARGTAKAHSS